MHEATETSRAVLTYGLQRSRKDALEIHPRHAPTKVSRSRIKRLRGMSQPQFRLRVGDIRVFYDVTETTVEILAIVAKEEAQAWLDEEGTSTPGGGTG